MLAICHDGVGFFFALFDICANLMVCCQSSFRSSLVQLLQYPDSEFVLLPKGVCVVGFCVLLTKDLLRRCVRHYVRHGCDRC